MAPTKSPTRKDKIEFSPTSQAKCRRCSQKIMKGSKRVGIETYNPRFGNYYHHFYHEHCVPTGTRLRLDRSPADELAFQRKQKVQDQRKVRERSALREQLRLLRLHFAQRLNVKAFIVFHDTTLDELTAKMPENRDEFLAINGMGPRKYQSFGGPILQVIGHYRRSQRHDGSHNNRKQQSSAAAAAVWNESSDIVEEIVAPMESLSCEEIVNRKFQDAEANGYVLEI